LDADGRAVDWWSAAAQAGFESRARCIFQLYDGKSFDSARLDATRTLGESIADLGGLRVALAAAGQARARQMVAEPVVAGLTPDQQFFVSFAQTLCEVIPESDAAMLVAEDSHPPAPLRVNGAVSNIPEFAHAFQCAPGRKMAPETVCSLW
jgi:predicted metalloendopeptidase